MDDTPRRALIVDDDTCIRMSLGAVLQGEGWETLEGRDGDEAVAVAVTDCPDVVLLDLMMPGKDGTEAFHELREDCRTSHIPVVVITAAQNYDLGTADDLSATSLGMGISAPEAILEKPLESTQVLEAVAQATAAF